MYIIILILSIIKISYELDIDLRLYYDSQSYTVTTQAYIDNDYFYLIPICLGTPPQCFQVFYEINYTHLLINPIPQKYSHHFNYSLSTTSKNTTKIIDLYKSVSYSWNDNLTIETYNSNFDWLFGVFSLGLDSYFDGKFGFGRNYTNSSDIYNEKYSIVHKLFNKGIIKRKIFGHKFFNKRKYLRLYIGEINIDDFNNNKDYPKCFVANSSQALSKYSEEFNHLWSCTMKKITILNETVDINNKKDNTILYNYNITVNNSAVFSTFSNMVYGPYIQGEQLLNYLLSLPAAKECNKHKFQDSITLECSWNTEIYKFPTNYIQLDGVTLGMYSRNYFYKEYTLDGENYTYYGRFSFSSNNYFGK